MSNGIVFDQDSARRIANATRGYEQEQSAPESVNYQNDGSYGRTMLVRTDSSFPINYSGNRAAGGAVVEKLADGSVKVIATAWVKDLNNTKLKPYFIYQARFSGVYTQDVLVDGVTVLKTFALYIVQSYEPVAYENFRLIYANDSSGTNRMVYGVTLNGSKAGYITAYDPSNANILFLLDPRSHLNIPFQIYGSGVFYYDESLKSLKITNYILYPFTFTCWAKFTQKMHYEDADRVSLYDSYYGAINNVSSIFATYDPLGLVREAGGIAKVICQWNYTTGLVVISANLFLYEYGIPSSGKPLGQANTSGISTGIGSGISGV